MYRTHRLAFTIFLVPFSLLAFGQSPEPSPQPVPQTESRWEKAISTFENWDAKNAVPDNPVLFVGSSSIRLWTTHKSFPGWPVINRGFGGSQISDVHEFASRIVLPYKPQIIVLYAGDNDVAGGKSPQQVFEDYQKFANLVLENLPDTHLVFIAIKPSPSRWTLWPKMKLTNDLIQKMIEGNDRLHFADVATAMLGDNGEPQPELFAPDNLHLSDTGYELWTRTVTPVVKPLLKK